MKEKGRFFWVACASVCERSDSERERAVGREEKKGVTVFKYTQYILIHFSPIRRVA